MTPDDFAAIPKGACAACGRLLKVEMGDRGPVKVKLRMRRRGYFRFCDDCLDGSRESVKTAGGIRMRRLHITTGPLEGHTWIVATR